MLQAPRDRGTSGLSAEPPVALSRGRARRPVAGVRVRVLALAQAGTGVNRPFTTVGAVLQAAIQRQVPAEDETYLGMVDGRPTWIPSGRRPVRLESEPAIVGTVAGLPAGAPVRIRDAMTRAGHVRYAAVQVQVRVAGQAQVGSYIVAAATAPSQRVILESARQYALVALGSLLLVGLVGWLVAGQCRARCGCCARRPSASRIPT